MNRMKEKVVVITGGGKGIGFGIASAFAEEGASLVLTGRTLETLELAKTSLEIGYPDCRVLIVPADGADESSVNQAIEQTVRQFGRLDVLINNAQTSKSGTLLADHTREDFDLAVYSGLYATFYYMRAAFPYLKESRGCVINFASAAGLSGKSGQASYAAAKEGIRGLSRVAATEWGPYDINVNVVCPLVMTPGLEKWKEQYPELYKKTIDDIPLHRFGDAKQDVGGLCLFLASDAAAYITGETISIQGGVGLRP